MLSLKDSILAAILASILVISKEILAFLPNIELVSFLLIIYTLTLGLKISAFSALLFAFLQMLLYGIGLWTPMYFIVWPLLAGMTQLLRKYLTTEFRLALFSGAFGLVFGFLFSLPYFIVDSQAGIAYFLKGIPFDLIHGIGNYLVMLVLYQPVIRIFKNLTDRYRHQ